MDPGAVSPDGGSWGLYQILAAAHGYGDNPAALLDAETNVAVAFGIWSESGGSWRAWSCRPY